MAEIAERYDLTEHSIFGLLSHFGESDDYWIAGGAVRAFMLNQPITTDVDFFFKTPEAFKSLKRNSATMKAIKIRLDTTLEECLDSFDFTICQLADHK